MTLEGIIGAVKNFGRAALLAGTMAISGCMGFANNFQIMDAGGDVYTDVRLRAGIRGQYSPEISAGERMHYIPIHPSDGGAARGGVETEFEDGSYSMIYGGIETSIGTESTRIRGGIDFRACGGEYYDRSRQPLPSPYNSQAFTRETLDSPYSPFIGFSQAVSKHWSIGFEVGFPYAEIEAEAGHHRYNREDVIMRGSWKGHGISYAIHFNFAQSQRYSDTMDDGGISIIYEKFEPEFGDEKAGAIESFSIQLTIPLEVWGSY